MRWVVVAALAAVGFGSAAPAARADVKTGREALRKGEWTGAEAEFKKAPAAEKGPALLGLGELYLLTGRYPEALQQATQAAALPATKGAALRLAGEIHRETGRMADAVKQFQAALALNPRDLRARVFLGIALHETGQGALAEKTLDLFFQDFNAGKIDAKQADQLTYTAMAARYLEVWQDANGTFQQAAEKDPAFILANLEWGDLFLLKYRADEAAKCFADVLKINPRHPRALVGTARAKVEAEYDVKAATKLADEALKTNPKYVPAFRLKARLELDDERYAPAEALLTQALAVNPADLESLALLAASRYLQDDTAGYDAQKVRALKQNPRFSDFFFIVAELAVRHHRYADAVQLYRQAVALDPKNAAASAALAANLLRLDLSHEAEALKLLAQSFERDGFNVRTFNTLNLYEEVIAKEYETVPGGIFTFRFNKKEKSLLSRYVPRSLQQAWDLYVKKYGFTPKNPITVELFTERQHYGARTIGLPEFGAQGTCFGQLITAMSPSSAEANWELVLWHELAHVFHLQLSNNRVPRWFTEGLAEYETNIAQPYWRREHGRELFLSLRKGDMWKLSELSAAFTRPDRPNGVVIAYYQSSLVIHYLAETYGFPKLVQALKLYGQGKHDAEVLPAITGKSVSVLDGEFQDYLRKRFSHYVQGFLFDQADYPDADAARALAESNPADAVAQAKYAAALLEDEPGQAMLQAWHTLAIDGKNALARYVLARALEQAKNVAGARAEYETLLKQGVDGYSIRFGLGQFAAQSGDVESAARHLAEAKKWDPDRVEPYALLMQLYEAKGRRDDLLKETEAYLDVQEHDHDAARLLVDQYAGDKRWADLARVAARAIGITPMEPFVHQQYGIALAQLKRPAEAIYPLESALAGGVRKPGPVRGLLALQYLLAGDKVKAKAAAEQALKEDPGNPDAAEVLKKAL